MATASSTALPTWVTEVKVYNTTAAPISVSASNQGGTNITTAEIPAGSASFVGVTGQRNDVFNVPGHGGFDSQQGLGDGFGQTVQTLSGGNSGIIVTATGTVVSATIQSDGSVLVA